MGGALGSGLGGRLLAWWSSGREKVSHLGLVTESRKKVGLGGVPDVTSPTVKVFVPEALILLIAYHTVAPHHVVYGPCGETRAVLPAIGGCRPCPPYPCQVGRTTADPSMLVSGRLQHVGSATSTGLLSEGAGTWQPGQHPSYHFPPLREDLLEVPD
ncbi:hypothetical protein BHM03_00001343 [Ensete ventricosum]|uniref:Uncharacterized protein n=1 Tax=Ensete ventricosum TaxID=4639 RepID=A0A445M944_ENSVE|nr:hypothetical protein BHM03_00001343 [Ensete ventricosum]